MLELFVRKPRRPAKRAMVAAPRARHARPRDFQRARLYRWETEEVLPRSPEPLSLVACAELVEQAYRWAEGAAALEPGWQPPIVGDGRGRRHACGSRQQIKLPRWARTRAIVLHECAHGLADDLHGPRFVDRYVALLDRFLGLDRDELYASLARHRIRIAIADELHSRRRSGERRG